MFETRLLDIDHLAYTEALALMRGLVELKKGSVQPEILMLLEHEPVLTMGRRSDACEIRVSQKYLEDQGIGVHHIERGGLITYHGPGQLVAYVIFDLKRFWIPYLILAYGQTASKAIAVSGSAPKKSHPSELRCAEALHFMAWR
ncbi:MAG: hypothetical protein P8X68_00455 [Desulfobacterales bacterium]